MLKNKSTFKRLDESLEKVVQENQKDHEEKLFKSRKEIIKLQQETIERLKQSLQKSKRENLQLKEDNQILQENNKTILKMCQFYFQEKKIRKKAQKEKKETKIANIKKSIKRETVEEDEIQNEWINVVKKNRKSTQ